MRTLHLYITRQVFATLVLTVIVFAFVLLLVNALREILALIIQGQASVPLVVEAIGLLVPFVLVFALPMGMLTATLLVFGRFSADQELTAVRASGISLVALSTPVLLLAVAASGLAALINLQLAPRCRAAYKELVYREGIARATSLITEDRYLDDFDGYLVYVGKKRGNRLENVAIYELAGDKLKSGMHAEWAEVLSDAANFQATLRLHGVHYQDFQTFQSGYAAEKDGFQLSYRPRDRGKRAPPLSDMTFFELCDKLDQLERISFEFKSPARGEVEQLREQRRRLSQVKSDLTMPLRVQIHRQAAFSFACIAFTLVGIPLGVRAHRRETSAGIAVALILVLVYYAFVIVAQALQDRPEWGPHLILWVPNFLFQVVGMGLFWRANRGF